MNVGTYSHEERKAVLEEILAAWDKYPDMRLGQLIANALHFVGNKQKDIFYVREFELVSALKKFTSDDTV